jgi:hypothetical protein
MIKFKLVLKVVVGLSLVSILLLFSYVRSVEAGTRLKIAPPPKGMYLGQTERGSGDITSFETAVRKKVALWWHNPVMHGQEGEIGKLSFDIAEAQRAWDNGYIVLVGAYEAYAGHKPFTVDKLLQGKYDSDLKKLADQFRQFGKPMFFATSREPNLVTFRYQGGFGPEGDKDIEWGVQNNKGFSEFDPSKFPNADLYRGLGDPKVCDGIERLAAAQRYYYDFFVNKEKLLFLTFESMGWAVPFFNEEEFLIDFGQSAVGSYRYNLYKKCRDFKSFYKGIAGYVDWLSINWYLNVPQNIAKPPILNYLDNIKSSMEVIRKVAPDIPILIIEFGFCDLNKDKKVRAGMNEILKKYPEIKAFALWGAPLSSGEEDCLIRPNTPEGDAFKKKDKYNPNYINTCVYF